jgi:hypothetical protein
MAPTGTKATEAAALAWVMDLERQAGREPVDKRYERAFAGDIWSPPRTIELKTTGTSFRGWFIWLETVQLRAAQLDPEFYIYVVENVAQGDSAAFTLKVLHGDRLRRLAERAKERHYFEMPWPVAEYDSAPGIEAL